MDTKSEALVFSKYLIGKVPDEKLVALYDKAIRIADIPMNIKEKKQLEFASKSVFRLTLLDAALAFGHSNHPLRKKLLIMSALLETRPENYAFYSTTERPGFFWMKIFLKGCSAVLKMMIGKILLLFV